jgi:hypothetical protein
MFMHYESNDAVLFKTNEVHFGGGPSAYLVVYGGSFPENSTISAHFGGKCYFGIIFRVRKLRKLRLKPV